MERPLERRNAVRTAVVWDAVQAVLDGGTRRVLDIGGGTGGFAVRVAGLGHDVTVVDPSPDALAALGRRAHDEGVAARVTGVQGDLGTLAEVAQDVDLVLCHGVLGLVDDPAAALAAIAGVLRPGGMLSLQVGQRHAAVLARAMAGHFTQARDLLTAEHGVSTAERRFTAEELREQLGAAGFDVAAVHGVRVFTDLVPSSLLDLEPGAGAALLELERAVAQRPEYLTVASQLHVLAGLSAS
ncbi:methyltransferase type 12 [Marmoricola sp. Leaf446]|uniref:methyltransferase n=1 Tax=Marmoricola sp. Leaf446 TaxID=1736379 RepID=UPI0006F7CA9A|nr:methyltransferase [Marmoricola sp. Leaf446]KQT91153.1 methyltransferase type 12 [Marmoricola sp. Leaf446]